MSELKGYKGKIREFLIQNKVEVGDLVKITSELTYSGILMPRYESGDESHVVLKLKSCYNIGIEFEEIKKIEKIGHVESSKVYQSGPKEKYHCGLEYPFEFLSQAISIFNKKYPKLIFVPNPAVETHGE